MALSAATTWEVQNGGSDTNGGGYVSGGTDYSQQAAAQLTLTDLACAGGTAVVTSVAGGFTSAMVGNLMRVNSGTNFVAGFYQVVTFTSGNQITLDRDPTSGGAGSGGNAKVGGALASPGMAMSGMVPGNDLFVKYSATQYDVTSTTENVSNGRLQFNSAICGVSADNQMRITGYDTTRTHTNADANRPTIRAGASLGACDLVELHSGGAGWIQFSNLIIDGNQRAVDCFEGAMVKIAYRRVKVGNTTGKGFAGTGSTCHLAFCDSDDCDTGPAFQIPAGSIAFGCISRNHAVHGFDLGMSARAVFCEAYNIAGGGADGFEMTSDDTACFNCTAYKIGRAGFLIGSSTDYQHTCANCLVYDCGQSSGSARAFWDAAGAAQAWLINCAWGGGGAAFASSHFQQINSITLSANPFINTATYNLELNGASGGGLSLRQAAMPNGVPIDMNLAVGARQWPDPLAMVHLVAPA